MISRTPSSKDYPGGPVVKTTLPLQGSIPGRRTRYRLPLHHVVRPKKIKNKEMVKKEKKKKRIKVFRRLDAQNEKSRN